MIILLLSKCRYYIKHLKTWVEVVCNFRINMKTIIGSAAFAFSKFWTDIHDYEFTGVTSQNHRILWHNFAMSDKRWVMVSVCENSIVLTHFNYISQHSLSWSDLCSFHLPDIASYSNSLQTFLENTNNVHLYYL